MKVLTEKQKEYSERTIKFLEFLETTSMTKSYKMPLLLSLFDNLKKEVDLKEIGEYFKNFYLDEVHKKDLNNKKHSDLDDKKYQKLAEDNPIKYLTEKGKNIEFFSYENKRFILNSLLYDEIKSSSYLLEEIKERIDYRVINYFRRKYMEE